ncbi:MAG: twin-arginine translocation signal domain-containing protein [Terracidiphilus sp.]
MNRRDFLGASATLAGSVVAAPHAMASMLNTASAGTNVGLDLTRHRFGVNYTPSHNWWFCWNDWNADPIRRDLDAIASLGADHLRILLIWPFFQPNPAWVSTAHLERLDQLLSLMSERNLDALVTVFTGQLSGWFFLPPFNRLSSGFYTDATMGSAQELFIRELARVMKPHSNVIGFDMGNEINTCWQAPTQQGDAWMARMFARMQDVLPDHLHVNGVDHAPWFESNTFSPQALAAARFPVMHCYPFWTGAVKYGGAMDPPSVKLLAAMATLIRAYAGTQEKPVWAGEFNTCIKDLPEKGQAAWLEKAVLAAIEQGVSWFSYWDSHDVDRKFNFNPLEYSLGLLTNDGRVKEQGRTFQQLANAYRGKPVTFPRTTLPAPPVTRTMEGIWQWILDWLGWKPTAA